MKENLILIISFLASCSIIKAQDTSQYFTIKKDTINIRGIVYDALGKPAPNVQVVSKNFDFKNYVQYPVSETDSLGRFELKRASFKDTLRFISFRNYIEVINNGSRYLTVNLPTERIRKLETIQVLAQRRLRKTSTPTFKIKSIVCFDCGWGGSKLPYFQGGEQQFLNFIRNMLSYPEKAIANNTEGDVEIGFTVDNEGSLKNYNILRGIGFGCEEQVINALKKSPKWVPGIFMGKPMAMPSSITINFKLTDK